ncbi:MAG: Dabb family protein [Roseiflexaceae bacterium]
MSHASTPVRHVVVFKYKSHVSEDQIRQVTDAFRSLQQKIPGIRAFEHGVNNSPEGKNLGFTHVYTLTFDSVAARDDYLPHPEHAGFGVLLGQLNVLADVFVVDYLPAE